MQSVSVGQYDLLLTTSAHTAANMASVAFPGAIQRKVPELIVLDAVI
jgi:hypothetical protein